MHMNLAEFMQIARAGLKCMARTGTRPQDQSPDVCNQHRCLALPQGCPSASWRLSAAHGPGGVPGALEWVAFPFSRVSHIKVFPISHLLPALAP